MFFTLLIKSKSTAAERRNAIKPFHKALFKLKTGLFMGVFIVKRVRFRRGEYLKYIHHLNVSIY